MNAKSALVKEFLDGKTLTIMTCFKTVGLTNLGREVSRMIERPFDVVISRQRKEGKSKHGSYITWYEYKLNQSEGNKDNKPGIARMREYLAQHIKEYRPKPKFIQPDLFFIPEIENRSLNARDRNKRETKRF